MAGIGFELRHLLKQDTYLGAMRAYGYAALIGSGPWVISILAVMALGMLSVASHEGASWTADYITQFSVSVTWLIAASLILTGPFQLIFTRYVSDRLYEGNDGAIVPNMLGLMTLVTLLSGGVGLALALTSFAETPWAYRVMMLMSFVLLSNVWAVAVFVAGLKAYRQVLMAFLLGYLTMIGLGLLLKGFGREGLLVAFAIGQAVLLFYLLGRVCRDYASDKAWDRDFLRWGRFKPRLLMIGLLYNLGVWVDKLAFWLSDITSVQVIGPLRAAPLHDLPLFVAYLSIIPGMAIFLMRIETDFAEGCREFDRSIRAGRSLEEIEGWRLSMLSSVRRGILDIFKVQGVTVVLLLLAGPSLMQLLGFSWWYLPLFNVFLIGVAFQVLFMAVLNVLFYLDRLSPALWLCLAFVILNLGLTLLSQQLGTQYYGYGYAVSTLLVTLAGFQQLDRAFRDLTYMTFMRQR